jgi:hypothetical protein
LDVVVEPQPTVSIQVDNGVVCVGGNSTITSSVSNGSGVFLYQWQSSPDGSTGWTNISSNGVSDTYNVPTGAAGVTYYRIVVTDLSNNCNDPVSSPVQVVINDQALLKLKPQIQLFVSEDLPS